VARALSAASGRERLAVASGHRLSVDGFAWRRPGGGTELWLANLTAQPQRVVLERIGHREWSAADEAGAEAPAGTDEWSLAPYATVHLRSSAVPGADQAP